MIDGGGTTRHLGTDDLSMGQKTGLGFFICSILNFGTLGNTPMGLFAKYYDIMRTH